MDMYIGNSTRQIHDFIYRIPDSAGPRQQPIGIGQQIRIPGISTADMQAIVDQHSRYGMVRVSEIPRHKAYIGICWDDKPISVDRLMEAMEHNQEVLIERGQVTRREAAVAANNLIDKHLQESHMQDTLEAMEMTIEEEDTTGGRQDSSNLLKEGIVIDKHAPRDTKPTSRKPQRRPRGR